MIWGVPLFSETPKCRQIIPVPGSIWEWFPGCQGMKSLPWHEDVSMMFLERPRVKISWIFERSKGSNCQNKIWNTRKHGKIKDICKKTYPWLAIHCDLFGMVKWPFGRLSDLQLGDKEVTLNHLVIAEILQQFECAMGKCYKRCCFSAAEQSNTTCPSRFIRGSASSVSEIVDVYDELVEAAWRDYHPKSFPVLFEVSWSLDATH